VHPGGPVTACIMEKIDLLHHMSPYIKNQTVWPTPSGQPRLTHYIIRL